MNTMGYSRGSILGASTFSGIGLANTGASPLQSILFGVGILSLLTLLYFISNLTNKKGK